MKASQIAISCHQKEKLQALRNAILNSAISPDADEAFRNIFLGIIDTLTPIHIDFLYDSWGENSTVPPHPLQENNPLLFKTVWKDLIDRGLLDGELPSQDSNNFLRHSTTELGDKLLEFIESPFNKI